MALGFLRRFFSRRTLGRNGPDDVLTLFTPQVAANRGTGTKLALAGVTLLGVALAGAVAFGALVTLFLAVGALYFLLTQVLGLELDIDPRAFMARAQQYASQAQRN
jgi:hypothetical protein